MNCEKRVEVVAVMADHCWVKPMSQPLCFACTELGRCRSNWLRQKTSDQTFEIPLNDPISLNVGDVVTLSIDGQRFQLATREALLPAAVGAFEPDRCGAVPRVERDASGRCWSVGSSPGLDVQSALDTNVSNKDQSMSAAMRFVLGFLMVVSVQAQAQLPEFTKLVDTVSPAVVNISTRSTQPASRPQQMPDLQQLPPFFREFFERGVPMPPQEREGRSLGSGFIVSDDGYVLTNNHVVEGADTVIVRLNDRREYVATIVGTDPRSDVALLKLDADDLPVVMIADSDAVKRGQWVVAIGSPFGFDYSVTAGIVSATGRALPDESYVPFIQTDVAINPGNSGGPLFNLDGEVVGINSQIFTRSGGFMGLSFAIPMNLVMNVAEQLKEDGIVRRGWLGVLIQEVNRDLALSFGLDKPMGALIAQASASGPAGKAGDPAR